ncbi:hypothetical protein BDAP_002788 [Binucleata daphniae]
MLIVFFIVTANFIVNKNLQRKEIRALTKEEWDHYKKCVLNLKKHRLFEDLSMLHANVDTYAHNHPRFLPWHRMFLLYFEKLLQVVNNDPMITVPYWDWTLDAEEPNMSIIFTEKYWGINECFEVEFPNKHCLERNDEEIDPLYNKAQINRLINKKMKYDEFREAFELVPHALVHFNIGGKTGDMSMMYSTNDPIFWHHHSFCDLLWHKKQIKNLKNRYDGKGADIQEKLKPFDKTVKEVLNLNDCNIEYIEYQPVRIQSVNTKVGRISDEYAQRHGYDIKKIRKIEGYMLNEKKKRNIVSRLLRFIFCLRD